MALINNDVVTRFTFAGNPSALTDYNKALGSSIGLLAGFGAATIAASGAIAAFTLNTTQGLDPLIQLSRRTGIAIGDLQELGHVASVTGSSSDALFSTIDSLQDKIGEAAQQGSQDFARLGINVRNANGEVRRADDVLGEIGQRLREMDISDAERMNLASALGVDSSLIQMLRLTGDEVQSLRDRAAAMGTLTQDQADAAAQLNDSYTTMKFGIDALRNSIAVGLAPQIDEIVGKFIDFISANRELISDGISRVLDFIQSLSGAIVRLSPVIAGIVVAFGVWKIATIGLGTVLATAFSPVYLITAAIVALLFVIDDLIVAFQGGESVIADFFENFFGIDIVPYLRDIVDSTVKFLGDLGNAFSVLIDFFVNLFKGIVALINGDFAAAGDAFSAILDSMLDVAIATLSYIGERFYWLLELVIDVGKQAAQGFIDGLLSIIDGAIDVGVNIARFLTDPIRQQFAAVIDFMTSGIDTIMSKVKQVGGFFGFGGDGVPMPDAGEGASLDEMMGVVGRLQPGGNINNQSSSNRVDQQVQIDIRTDNPREAGRAVTDGLQAQLTDAQTQFATGGF